MITRICTTLVYCYNLSGTQFLGGGAGKLNIVYVVTSDKQLKVYIRIIHNMRIILFVFRTTIKP